MVGHLVCVCECDGVRVVYLKKRGKVSGFGPSISWCGNIGKVYTFIRNGNLTLN